jgi:hypothetical protein
VGQRCYFPVPKDILAPIWVRRALDLQRYLLWSRDLLLIGILILPGCSVLPNHPQSGSGQALAQRLDGTSPGVTSGQAGDSVAESFWQSPLFRITILGGAIPTVAALLILAGRIMLRQRAAAPRTRLDDWIEIGADLALYGLLMALLTPVGLLVLYFMQLPVVLDILLWVAVSILLFWHTFADWWRTTSEE